MPAPKPFVQIACACEKVLHEPDDVSSLIRVVDTYTIERPQNPLPAAIGLALPLTIFVSLKSGDVIGEHVVGIRLVKPDGTVSPVRQWPMVFNGGEHGANVQIAFALAAPEDGLYWFDVLWGEDEDVLTRIPLRVRLKTVAASPEPNKTATSQPPLPS